MVWRNIKRKSKLIKSHIVDKVPVAGLRMVRLKKQKQKYNLRPVWSIENMDNKDRHVMRDVDRIWTIKSLVVRIQNFDLYPKSTGKKLLGFSNRWGVCVCVCVI